MHKNDLIAFIVCLFAGVLFASCALITNLFSDEEVDKTIDRSKLTLVWQDEFDDGDTNDDGVVSPSSENWVAVESFDGNGNFEDQYYINSSTTGFDVSYEDVAYIEDGYLTIKAIKEDSQWYSAKLTTSGIHYPTYGYFEASIKAPSDDGTWPAFWMMPEESLYGSWPSSGEIDIFEYAPGVTGNKIYSTLHYGESYDTQGSYTLESTTSIDPTNAFHTYAVYWSEDLIKAYYDDEWVGNIYKKSDKDWDEWPFDQDFYVILNLAMGGTLGGDIPSNLSSATMKVDWVRVWSINN